jgi:uncharacterized protein YegL
MPKLGIILLGCMLGLTGNAVFAAERDVMLVLDNSGSMRGNDPARLSVSAVTDFIRAQPSDVRVGIVMFADSPRLLQPLTSVNDNTRGQLLGSLDALGFSGQWTDTASAVERALYELRLSGREDVRHAIILVTDGIIDTGNSQRDQEKSTWLQEMLAREAQERDVRIFGIAFTENADYQLLQSLAGSTNGDYFRALRAQDIGPILERIDTVLERSAQRDRTAMSAAERIRSIEPDFVTSPAGSSATTTTQPAVSSQPAERIQLDSDAIAEPAAESQLIERDTPTAITVSDENTFSRWRVLLIMLGLVAIGVVAASILWSEELTRLLRRTRRTSKQEDHGPAAVLYDVYDPSDIKRHEISAKPVVIGRVSGADPAMDYVVVDERTVGRWHATIERRGQSFWIRDEGSVNGTYVNDQRVTSEHPLKHGDIVRVHRHEFEFVIPELFDSDRTMIAGTGNRQSHEQQKMKDQASKPRDHDSLQTG